MLPPVLSANICSLLSGVDRYAMSVLWELDPDTYQVPIGFSTRPSIRAKLVCSNTLFMYIVFEEQSSTTENTYQPHPLALVFKILFSKNVHSSSYFLDIPRCFSENITWLCSIALNTVKSFYSSLG
jgi:hypothetical protein